MRMNASHPYGGYKVCKTCGKAFYVLRPELWAYKRKIGSGHDAKIVYFHTYSCKRAFDLEYEKTKVDRRTTCHSSKLKPDREGMHCSDCRYFSKGKYGFYDCSVSPFGVKPEKNACRYFKPLYSDWAEVI